MPADILIGISENLKLMLLLGGHERLIFDFIFFVSRLDLLCTSASVSAR